ncbi:MAG: YbjQ family protein [Rhodanobacter sp.]
MLVVTTENVPGHQVKQVKGQVFGVVVRSRGIGGNVMAGLRSIVGGEIHEYTQMLEEARRHALDRLVANATVMGANAVVMMRFDSAEIGQTMSEIVAYGTAVVLDPPT